MGRIDGADLTADHCTDSNRNRPQPGDRPTDRPPDSKAGNLAGHDTAHAVAGSEALGFAMLVLRLLGPCLDLAKEGLLLHPLPNEEQRRGKQRNPKRNL